MTMESAEQVVNANPDLDSVSDVDLEPLNGGSRETNWKDARKRSEESRASAKNLAPKLFSPKSLMTDKPVLEDGAD